MYEYASGLIRVLEKRLPNTTDIERMVLAEDARTAFTVLNDTDFSEQLLNAEPEDYEKVISDHAIAIKNLFAKISENKYLFNFMFIKQDFHNIKVLLKKKYGNVQENDLISDLGIYPISAIEKVIAGNNNEKEENNFSIPFEKTVSFIKDIEAGILTISQNLPENPTSADIELEVDKIFYKVQLQLAKKIKSRFVKEFAMIKIDSANMKIFLRSLARDTDKTKDFFTDNFLEGGNIQIENYLNALEHGSLELFFKDLKSFFVSYGLEHIFNDFLDHRSLWKLEKDIDNFEMNFVKRRAKHAAVSPSILVGYYFAQQTAIKNVRLIMSGKLSGLGTNEIKERVRETY